MSNAPLLKIEYLTVNFWGADPAGAPPSLGEVRIDTSGSFKPRPAASTVPAIGEYWPEEGGIYAGLRQYPDGKLYHLIFSEFDVGPRAWGEHGKETGADDRSDGLVNGGRLLNAPGEFPAAMAAAEYEADGHQDFYLPAIGELAQAWQTIGHHFSKERSYWSSTQYSAYGAYITDFDDGLQDGLGKNTGRLVRPVRRFLR